MLLHATASFPKISVRWCAVILAQFGVLLACSDVRAQDPPPLEAPELEAPKVQSAVPGATGTRAPASAIKPVDPAVAKPGAKPLTSPSGSGAVQPGAAATPRPAVRPMLAIPGLTTPAARAPVSGSRLAAPAPEAVVPGSGARLSEGVRDSIPLSLEPIADDPPPARPPGGRAGAPPFIGTERPPVHSTPGSLEDDPNVPAVIRRNFGRIQRYLGQPPAAAARPVGAVGPKLGAKPVDPEPDAVVKKRLEKELRGALGDRVRSVEVRVSGRNVLVAAKPAWFWLRRGVKRSIETMPSLQNYRVRVDLDD